MVIPPGDQHGKHPVTPGNRLLNDLAVVRRPGNEGDTFFERVEFAYAAFPADTHHFIPPVQRELHHVLP